MGIHPKFSVVIGVSNAAQADPRFTKRVGDFFEKLPAYFLDGSSCPYDWAGKDYYDVLYNPANEYVVGGGEDVVGYLVAQCYDHDLLYALYACFPDIFQAEASGSGSEYGYKEFPRREIEQYELEILEAGQDSVHDSWEAVQFCNRYGFFYPFVACWKTAAEFQAAKKTLELAGWNFGYEELKKLLVWNWE